MVLLGLCQCCFQGYALSISDVAFVIGTDTAYNQLNKGQENLWKKYSSEPKQSTARGPLRASA